MLKWETVLRGEFTLSNKSSFRIWNKAQEIIRENKRINKWDLMDKLGISRSTYEKETSFWKYKFREFIGYDRKTSEWIWQLEEPEIAEPIVIPSIQLSEDWRSEL